MYRTPRIIALLIAIALVGCEPPLPPTPTRPPNEPATTYVGELHAADGSVVGLVALIVTETRARALACGGANSNWHLVSAWLNQGERKAGQVTSENAERQARLSAALQGEEIAGKYEVAGGSYDFTARVLVSAEQIAQGVEEGVYWLTSDRIPGVQGEATLMFVLRDATNRPEPTPGAFCGVLFQAGKPISRVALADYWQQGLTPFGLIDIFGTNNQPTRWDLPGRLGHIDSIGLPVQPGATN